MTVCTLGEVLLRLSPPGNRRHVQASRFEVEYGGAEANVAVNLAQFGVDSRLISRLPAHAIGDAALGHLLQHGVDVSYVYRGGPRLGLYYHESGAAPRPSSVIYDRAGSSFVNLCPEEVNWTAIFEDVDWFHWTGITPALGDRPLACIERACKAAKAANITVSCDLNYRSQLWEPSETQAVMRPLMEYVDICIAGRGDGPTVLGCPLNEPDEDEVEVREPLYFDLAHRLKRTFDFRAVAITLRQSFSPTHHGWGALLLDDQDCKEPYCPDGYDVDGIVDRVGAGDAFSAGLIYGLLRMEDTRRTLDFALAAGCLKHSVPGDANLASVSEIENVAQSSGAHSIKR